jgi:DNA-binding NarL/FixJ family response regulator
MPARGQTPIRIVLAHPHPVVCLGVRAVLAHETDCVVVGETGDGPEVIPLAGHLQPDALVVDVNMPGLGGINMIPRVHQCSPRTRVVVLAACAGETYAVQVLRNGAAAYVVKGVSATVLVEALRQTTAGNSYVSAPLTGRVVFANARGLVSVYDTLTSREREILDLSADGQTASSIAKQLCVSRRTVEKHRANLSAKLGFRTQTELLHYASCRTCGSLSDPTGCTRSCHHLSAPSTQSTMYTPSEPRSSVGVQAQSPPPG